MHYIILCPRDQAGPSAVVLTINWSQPVIDFFIEDEMATHSSIFA